MISPHHAKYYAYALTIKHGTNGVERITQSLFDATVDLNPHQIEAALFALKNPLDKGVLLADEVGLGKTIEAALVLSQFWAERKRRLLIICPASLRKQWAMELVEKFHLPSLVLDARSWRIFENEIGGSPLFSGKVIIVSFHFAARIEERLRGVPWDLVVIDEAHKLRNVYRRSNKIGKAIKRALEGRQKILLTATPLQNSLLELYGLSILIDDHIFGSEKAFKRKYLQKDADLGELRNRIKSFVKRTLRRQVLEYIKYTERRPITVPFKPTDKEQELYEAISNFLNREDSYAIPKRQRHLTGLILRKLLASSPHAIVQTLKTIKKRLEKIKEGLKEPDEALLFEIISNQEIEEDYIEELPDSTSEDEETIDKKLLDEELQLIDSFIHMAESISIDTKAKALLTAIELGFKQMQQMGAAKKAVIFTESKRTLEYLSEFLSANGFAGKVITFSGTNTSPQARRIYSEWLEKYKGTDRVTGTLAIDRRTAIIDYFREKGSIMIATEAGAEGINLQFCSLVINYDLPWNPQRIEQRIGRCHRYGQKFDVVVINFLNERNAADRRVLELLTEKFRLFSGVFGTSDEILGRIESGIDFEKKILEIYETCRTPEAIEEAFSRLQKELEASINKKIEETKRLLLEHFDEDIHELLRLKLREAEQLLDRVSRWFWALTKFILTGYADFDDKSLSFYLKNPLYSAPQGSYQLIRKGGSRKVSNAHTYRLSHPLGQHVLGKGREQALSPSEIVFDYSSYLGKISLVEKLKGKSGWLKLDHITISAFQQEEHLVFTGISDEGSILDSETCEKLFNCPGSASPLNENIMSSPPQELIENSKRRVQAKISEIADKNRAFFQDEVEKLDKWANDKILAAEQALKDTKARIMALKREARLAQSLEEQQAIQKRLKKLELLQRRQRRKIFDVEDEIVAKRDGLIDALEEQLKQKTETDELFTVRWTVI